MKRLHQTATERRRLTRNRIYGYLYDAEQGHSKQDIADQLGISLPTVHQNLSELMKAELVQADGVLESTGGRPAARLRVVENARFALGVSVSAHHFRVLAANLRLKEVAYAKYSHEPTTDLAVLGHSLALTLEEFLTEFGLNREKLLGVGLALPGILDAPRNRLLVAPTLHMQNRDLTPLAEAIPYSVRMSNDATSAGAVEWFLNQSVTGMAYLLLEEGVGGALFLNGQPYTGSNGRSSEFGHICVQPQGLLCQCGQHGCLEAYCSSARISTDLGITVEQFFQGVAGGNLAYQTLWNDYLSHLARGVVTIRMALDCDIVLGGYPVSYMGPYLPRLRSLIAACDPFDDTAAYLRFARSPRHAVPLGASLPFIRKFLATL